MRIKKGRGIFLQAKTLRIFDEKLVATTKEQTDFPKTKKPLQ